MRKIFRVNYSIINNELVSAQFISKVIFFFFITNVIYGYQFCIECYVDGGTRSLSELKLFSSYLESIIKLLRGAFCLPFAPVDIQKHFFFCFQAFYEFVSNEKHSIVKLPKIAV